jgi:hypothetical protein
MANRSKRNFAPRANSGNQAQAYNIHLTAIFPRGPLWAIGILFGSPEGCGQPSGKAIRHVIAASI